MWFVVNMETQAVITYSEGDRILYSNEEIAKYTAARCSLRTHKSYVVVSYSIGNKLHKRELAPFFKKD